MQRGFFGIGVENISKKANIAALFRTAHAFGASFLFTVNADYSKAIGKNIDTSHSAKHLPLYEYDHIDDMPLPKGTSLVGIELTEDAVELPSFRHPKNAIYILGPERGSLSEGVIEKTDFVVKIPTKFCINLGLAGAVVMYDRLTSMQRFPKRPIMPGGPTEELPKQEYGIPKCLKKKRGIS